MRAVVIHQHGDLSQLTYTEIPQPSIGPNDVLVRVKACALNHLDIWVRLGLPGLKLPMPHVCGSDIAGEIEKLGKNVKSLKIGQRVILAPGIVPQDDPYFNTDWESLSPNFQIFGLQIDGGYAEFVKSPARNVIPVSGKLTFDEWASIPLVFLTAWHMLVTRANLQKGETILVHAAGSGVGAAGIQVARYLGAKVITTAGSDEKLEHAKKLGAHEVINYRKSAFDKEVHVLTKGQGVDVVLEHIGPDTFQKSVLCLARKGRLVTCGVTSGPNVEFSLRSVFAKQQSIIGCYMGGMPELRKVLKLVETGKLRPVVDQAFPLSDAARAQERMLARKNFGKIILNP